MAGASAFTSSSFEHPGLRRPPLYLADGIKILLSDYGVPFKPDPIEFRVVAAEIATDGTVIEVAVGRLGVRKSWKYKDPKIERSTGDCSSMSLMIKPVRR